MKMFRMFITVQEAKQSTIDGVQSRLAQQYITVSVHPAARDIIFAGYTHLANIRDKAAL